MPRLRCEDCGKREHGFSSARGKLEKRLTRVLEMHITHGENKKFQAHLDKHDDEMLTFWNSCTKTSRPRDSTQNPAPAEPGAPRT